MTVQVSWEHRLLAWAQEARESFIPREAIQADSQILLDAYDYCAGLTRRHSKTFFLASGLLPRDKRVAVRALYAFCRVTDDLVDEATQSDHTQRALESWQHVVSLPHPPVDEPVALAWADVQLRHRVPAGYPRQLIDGVARDLTQKRYATFGELAEYAYGVASTVGLMAMHIIGFRDEAALPYAVKLGVALQLTNILRDVGEDWRAGRLYLPQDELASFGLSEFDIAGMAAGEIDMRTDPRWRAFMAFQIERNRQLYAESWPGVGMLNPDGRMAIGAAAELYCAILTDIEANDYDVFSRRASLSTWGKIRRLPGIWRRARRA